MEQHLFYSPDAAGEECFLSPEESRHCIKVLRMNIGDPLLITNGKGILYEGEVGNTDPKSTLVILRKVLRNETKRPFHLHIAIAPTKNMSRFEWFLEKSTEMGIDEITPVICEHSERRVVKIERLEKIVTAAAKQSYKSLFPKLNEAVTFRKFLGNRLDGQKFIAYIDEDHKPLLQSKYSRGSNVLIMIGPEGDFSRDEVKMAVEAGYDIVSLGEYRLRTETAGIAACHTIAILNQ